MVESSPSTPRLERREEQYHGVVFRRLGPRSERQRQRWSRRSSRPLRSRLSLRRSFPTGQPVTFTATVSGGSGMPIGSVAFKNGTKTLGTVKLVSGLAIFKRRHWPWAVTRSRPVTRVAGHTPPSRQRLLRPWIPSRPSTPPIAISATTAAAPPAAPALGGASTNALATDAALRALLLDDSTVTGKPRPLFVS